jgi:hypothetical protein
MVEKGVEPDNPPKSKAKLSRRTVLRLGGLAALGAGPLGLASKNWICHDERELRLQKWDADGFRLALLTDFHVNDAASVAMTQRALRVAIDAKPDVILLGGDFIDYSEDARLQRLPTAFKDLGDAGCPVLAVLGNHEYWTHAPRKVVEAVQKLPLRLLRNEPFDVEGVTIAGIDDGSVRRDRTDFLKPGAHSRSLVSLFHEPDYVTRMPDHVSLQLSGHSHGGQICLPGGIALHTPNGAKKYIAGYYDRAPVPVFVSRGIGTQGVHARVYCRPEVNLLTIRSA